MKSLPWPEKKVQATGGQSRKNRSLDGVKRNPGFRRRESWRGTPSAARSPKQRSAIVSVQRTPDSVSLHPGYIPSSRRRSMHNMRVKISPRLHEIISTERDERRRVPAFAGTTAPEDRHEKLPIRRRRPTISRSSIKENLTEVLIKTYIYASFPPFAARKSHKM